MTQDTTSHAWFAEQIAAYLTNGLEAEEQAKFETHADECTECAAKLTAAKNEDESLRGLFEGIGPAADFEDRVIRRLRISGRKKFALPVTIRLHPVVMRTAGAAAAIIVFGALGYSALNVMQNQRRVAMGAGQTLNSIAATSAPSFNYRESANKLAFSYANPNPDTTRLGSGYKMVRGLEPTFAVSADINPSPQREKQGQHMLSSEGRIDFQKNPFVGTNRDNIYARAGSAGDALTKDLIGSPYVANDSVMLPTDDNDGAVAPSTPTAGPAQSSNYSYQDRFNAPAPSVAKYYQPVNTPAAPRQTRSAQEQANVDQEKINDKERQLNARQMVSDETTSASALVDKLARRRIAPLQSEESHTDGKTFDPNSQPVVEAPDSGRKIIRHGEMSFEVDSFDSAFVQITKIAAEEHGFVSDTDSEKLANGKMSGTVTVRLPPDHLDTLTLKLRALGDLKGQKIAADDITKEYTDLQSELRAASAMEDRLLDIIKTSKGQVKDLLAAEKEVGIWREKVEQVTGEINYYNNLVSLSTLQISLTERDIRQAALASERETVDMGIETDDVEKARADAIHTLDGVKARIIQADLKKLDAGQLAATITAQVSPDAAGPVIDHFRQLGRVARMNMDRQQTVPDGTTTVPPGVKVERLDTQLQISIYNLANVSPRQTTNVSMACPDVEKAYHAILVEVAEAGGRVVNSSLNRIKPDQTDGMISFETPRERADAVLAKVRLLGEVMHLTATENPDAANVTSAKEGFAVMLASTATVAPRETITATLMPAASVADAYHAVLAIVQQDHGNVATAQLQEQNSRADSANLVFDVSREHLSEIEKAIASAIGTSGRVISRQNSRSNDTEHTLDSKVQFSLMFASADALQPREVTTRLLAVADVTGTYSRILAVAQQAGAKVAAAVLDQSNPSNPTGQLDLIIPRTELPAVEKMIDESRGGTVSKSIARSADLNSTTDEKVELRLTMGDLNQLPPRQTTTMNVQVSDPESASSDLQAAALAAGGRIVEQHLVKDDKYQAHLVIEVPLAKGSDFIDQVRGSGTVNTIERTEDQNVPEADFAEAKLDITLNAATGIVGPDAGLWTGLKSGISTSVRGLAYSLELVTIGVCLALPWVLLGWLGWKAARRIRTKRAVA